MAPRFARQHSPPDPHPLMKNVAVGTGGAAAGGGGGGDGWSETDVLRAENACLRRADVTGTYSSSSSVLLTKGVKEDLDAVLAGLPSIDEATVGAIIAELQEEREAGELGDAPTGQGDRVEEAEYHPFVARILNVVDKHTCCKSLRRFYEFSIARDGPGKGPTPDFSYTHIRESEVTPEALLVSVEVKCKGKMSQGFKEAASYAYRRLAELLRLHKVHVLERKCESFALCTDGWEIQIIRTAPRDEPPRRSPRLPLWTADGSPNQGAFTALARLLSATPRQLGSIDTLLDQCTVVTGVSEGEVTTEDVALGDRIGQGGSADVYTTMWKGEAAVVKRARARKTRKYLVTEWKHMHELLGCETIPRILAPPKEYGATKLVAKSIKAIVMSNNGVPLHKVVEDTDSLDLASVARSACQDVLQALRFAHEKGIAHLDIRPNNVVFHKVEVEDVGVSAPQFRATLVDWGLSLALGAAGKGVRGRVEFASEVQFDSLDGWECSQDMDLESVAYLYAALSRGDGAAPWGEVEYLAKEERDKWVASNSENPAVRFLHRVRQWRREDRPQPIPDSLYNFEEG